MKYSISTHLLLTALIGLGSISNTHAQLQRNSTPVISLLKLKNLYVNVENPLQIAVPEVADSTLTVSITGCGTPNIDNVVATWFAEDFETGNLMKVVETRYLVWVTESGRATISTKYVDQYGTPRTNNQFFQCLKLEKPVASFMGVVATDKKGEITQVNLQLAQGVTAKTTNGGFPYKWTVSSFTLTLTTFKRGKKMETSLSSESNFLTNEMKDLLRTAHEFDEIRIENIKAVGEVSEFVNLEPIYVRVM